ncbi:hypothetical protein PG993_014842 [Apiospora rasikravindrae]|uniref:Nephrocystin 3-like N-terminal domain-containing protein n=1 Tax=Apiospora rasikravindrae TaxID=990691 RepID=A0ABR1RR17_9PEZI
MSRFGLKVLAEGTDPSIDIVAVHGLNGHREKTWEADSGVLWLRDFLPEDFDDARIMTFGYNAATHSPEHISSHSLHDHGQKLVGALAIKRRGHSALIYSKGESSEQDDEHHSIHSSTLGVIFMGTPHLGSKNASMAKMLLNIASPVVKTTKNILEHLEQQSAALDLQRKQYAQIKGEIRTLYCFEEYETKIGGKFISKSFMVSGCGKVVTDRTFSVPLMFSSSLKVVPKQSAAIPEQGNSQIVSIPGDHRTMVKFAKNDDGTGYEDIKDCILRWRQNAAAETHVRAICSTIRFSEMHCRYLAVEKLSPDKTGSWFFESDVYREWDKSDTSLLIISGKPGSGKSGLMKMAVESAKKAVQNAKKKKSHAIIPVYFFFDGSQEGDTRLHSALGMYRTVLHQIISCGQPISASVLRHYKDFDKADWTIPSLQSATEEILSNLTSANTEVRIFLDALDECCKDDIDEVLSHLRRLVTKKGERIKALVSARDMSKYENFLPESAKTLVVHENNTKDICAYTEDEVQRLPEAARNRLAKTITQRAKGVFLWVRLVVAIVKKDVTFLTPDEVLERVGDLPDGILHIYDRIVAGCPDDQRKDAVALLQLVVFSQKPLSLQQMMQAFAFLTMKEPTEAAYRSRLASLSDQPGSELNFRKRLSYILLGLVEYENHGPYGLDNETDERVQLIHGTVRTYLLEKGLALLQEDLKADVRPKSHLAILKLCLRVIDFRDLKSPLGAYAGYFWLRHAQESDALLPTDDDIDLPRDVYQCPRRKQLPVLANLYQEYHKDRLLPNTLLIEGEPNLMVLMASAGCSNLVLRHAKKCTVCASKPRGGPDNNTTTEIPKSDAADRALFQAVANENVAMIRLFAQHRDVLPIDPNYVFSAPDSGTGLSPFQSSAIYKACYVGHAEMVRELLDMGADIGRAVPGGYRTGLHAAVACRQMAVLGVIFDHASRQWGQGSPRRLLSLTADVWNVGKGVTALHVAVYYGRAESVRWLLQRLEDRVDEAEWDEVLELRTLDGKTALDLATERGWVEIRGMLEALQ